MTEEPTLEQFVATVADSVAGAIENLRNWFRENPDADSNEWVDVICDFADNDTPAHLRVHLRIVVDNCGEISMVIVEPSLVAPHEASPAEAAQLAVFERLLERLRQEWEQMMEGLT